MMVYVLVDIVDNNAGNICLGQIVSLSPLIPGPGGRVTAPIFSRKLHRRLGLL